jgi:4-hydroxy-tetrahydrodipicolinate synthase
LGNIHIDIEEWGKRLHAGLIPAVPVPFDAKGRIHRAAHDAYVRYMAQQPVQGVAVWAHTGRGLLLSAEQRREVLRCWRVGLPPDRCVVAGVGANAKENPEPEANSYAALKMAEEALELGADAFLVHPPTVFRELRDRDERIVRHHKRLAALNVPLVLFYLYEAAGGILYSPAVLRELLALPQVIGIKMATLDSIMTFQDVAHLILQEQPHKLLITGEDRFLGYSLMCGARAALIGMGAACCRLQAELIRSIHHRDQSARFLELSRKVDRLACHTFIHPMEGYIRRMLWVLVHQEVIPMEAANDPWGPDLPESEFQALGRLLREIGDTES